MTTVLSAEKQGHPEEGPHGRPCRHPRQQSNGDVLHHAVERVPLNDHLVGAWETGAEDYFIKPYYFCIAGSADQAEENTSCCFMFLINGTTCWPQRGLHVKIKLSQYTVLFKGLTKCKIHFTSVFYQ